VITPDDILAGFHPEGPVVVYDDDHYYIGGVIAELLRRDGLDVTLVTPANEISTWTRHTEEQYRIQQRIVGLEIPIETCMALARVMTDHAVLGSIYTGRTKEIEAATVVMATSRAPQDALYHSLAGQIAIDRIGDCLNPGTIASAVYSGHKFARELDASVPVPVPFLRDSRTL
ncbi:MAG: NADH:flavin oxidoreductase, partial [Actinobacteria bacterium]|nr:NADH:flavin oxidoreductase [Actinomycetota bacterium]